MIRFTRHAHERLMDRHGAVLDVAECLQVCSHLSAAIGDQTEGDIECEVVMREGRLRFVAVVNCERRQLVTVLPWGKKNPTPKRWKKARQANRHYHEGNQRDYRRMFVRKSER